MPVGGTAAAASASLVARTLEEYGAATRVALASYLGPREPYRHLYGIIADYPRRGGRMLRPSLCIATARAFGAELEDAVRAAVAIELLHNAFLVHDDVEDESESRRGRPTLHRLHGTAVAVNVGDALALLGLRALMDGRWRLGTRLTLRLLEEAERMVRESIEGQAIELGWQRDNARELRDDDYLGMVLKKTCWYTTIFPLRVGALVARGSEPPFEQFVRLGFFLGAAFQIQDDVLNLAGDATRYGKDLDGDVSEGKRTLVLLQLLRAARGAERQRLDDFLGRPRGERTAAEVRWVRERIDEHGCIDYAKAVAHALAGAARHEYERLAPDLPDSPDKEFLAALPAWVLARA
jgi:geranylgeranyl diphosphate synthase type II